MKNNSTLHLFGSVASIASLLFAIFRTSGRFDIERNGLFNLTEFPTGFAMLFFGVYFVLAVWLNKSFFKTIYKPPFDDGVPPVSILLYGILFAVINMSLPIILKERLIGTEADGYGFVFLCFLGSILSVVLSVIRLVEQDYFVDNAQK